MGAALAVVVFLIYINLGGSGSQQLSLWYLEGDIPPAVMESLATDYNSGRGRDSYALSLRGFSTEDELASAFEQAQPDLLLCSYARAADLGSRGLLGKVDLADRDYLPAIEEALPYAGKSFFPIGSKAPVLVYSPSLLEGAGISPDFESFESFLLTAEKYTAEKGSPFFSSESLLPYLSTCCASLGYRLEGTTKQDGRSEEFAGTYNALASAAIGGSYLPPGADRLELAAAGLLPCVILDSPLSSGLPEGLSYGALPLPETGRQVYVPDILGFAVTGANTFAMSSVRDFLLWMQDGFSTDVVLSLAMVPVSSQLQTEGDSSALQQLLLRTYRQEAAVYPPLGSFYKNCGEMEKELCRTLDLLY